MPTPKAGYFLKDGSRVPGTTTVIGRFKDSGGLIHWAWEQGRDGLDYRASRDTAGEIGNLAHALIEQNILGRPPEDCPDLSAVDPEKLLKARGAFDAYMSWASQSRLEIVETEMPLLSEEHRFGGTPDAVGLLDGKHVLLDWKSSNRIYGDYLTQIAAYAHLIEANRPYKIEGFHLCRFAKEHGDFSHHYFPDLSEAWRMFVLLREAYDIDKILKKRAG